MCARLFKCYFPWGQGKLEDWPSTPELKRRVGTFAIPKWVACITKNLPAPQWLVKFVTLTSRKSMYIGVFLALSLTRWDHFGPHTRARTGNKTIISQKCTPVLNSTLSFQLRFCDDRSPLWWWLTACVEFSKFCLRLLQEVCLRKVYEKGGGGLGVTGTPGPR